MTVQTNSSGDVLRLFDHATWASQAACTGLTKLFYPAAENSHHIAKAKQVCMTCPALEPCRQAGIDGEERGVWGGLSERDRRELRNPNRATRPDTINHGTNGGWQMHLRHGIPACEPCKVAHKASQAMYRDRRRQNEAAA